MSSLFLASAFVSEGVKGSGSAVVVVWWRMGPPLCSPSVQRSWGRRSVGKGFVMSQGWAALLFFLPQSLSLLTLSRQPQALLLHHRINHGVPWDNHNNNSVSETRPRSGSFVLFISLTASLHHCMSWVFCFFCFFPIIVKNILSLQRWESPFTFVAILFV